jgi:hypothetical protein
VSEHEESGEPDPTIPGEQAGQHDMGPSSTAGTRRQRAARLAGAVTSRTAGWMVAAALAGSLVTLLLDGSLSQPATGQVAFRNVGRSAQAPAQAGGRTNWRIAAVPATPQQVYAAPGGPLAAGTVGPACAFGGQGVPPVAVRRARHAVIFRKGHRASWVAIGKAPGAKRITVVRLWCQMMPLQCRPAAGVRIGWVPAFRSITIKGHGRTVIVGPGGRPQRRLSIQAKPGQVRRAEPATRLANVSWLRRRPASQARSGPLTPERLHDRGRLPPQ